MNSAVMNLDFKGKRISTQVSLDRIADAIASLGDRIHLLKGETWRFNVKTRLASTSLWHEVINKLGLSHDEKTRHALYDLWRSKRHNIDKLVEKRNNFGNDEEKIQDSSRMNEQKDSDIGTQVADLVDNPSLPLASPPNTRSNRCGAANHKNDKHILVAETSLAFTATEWKDAFSRTTQKMKDDWTNIFYDKLISSGVTCCLKFKTPYIRAGTRKQNCRFFCCYATCNIGQCLRKYQLILRNHPEENSSVLFLVRTFGEENHNPTNATSTRHLTGNRRHILGKRANEVGPLSVFQELIGNADKALLTVGNETPCPTMETIKKAAADYRTKMRIDEDSFKACRIIRQVYIKEDNMSSNIHGYIHDIAEMPFRVHLYTESQIQRYINYVKSVKYSFVHIDATGGILKKMQNQNQSLLYVVLFKDGSDAYDTVPLAHSILTDHTVPSICYYLNKLAHAITEVNGKLVLPSFFVIDFSAATMNAILQAFNMENVNTHLNRCWNVIQRKYTKQELKSLSFLHLCCCHVIHAMARSLTSIRIEKKLRRAVLHILALMLCSNDIDQLYDMLELVLNIFGNPDEKHGKEKLDQLLTLQLGVDEESASLLNDKKKILKQAERRNDELRVVDEYFRSNTPIIHQSPFNREALRRYPNLADLLKSKLKSSNAVNPLFLPSIIRIIYRWWAYLPLWTGLLMDFEERYSCDARFHSPITYNPVRLSNAMIESYFRTFKRNLRKGKKSNCPSDIIMELHQSIQTQSKANEYGITQSSKGRKKRKVNVEERWGKRPQKNNNNRSAYFQIIDKYASERTRTKPNNDRSDNIFTQYSDSEETTCASSLEKSTVYSEKLCNTASPNQATYDSHREPTSSSSKWNSFVSSEYSTDAPINLDTPTVDDERSRASTEFDLNTNIRTPISASSDLEMVSRIIESPSSKEPQDQLPTEPESWIGRCKLRWPKFQVNNTAFEGQSYSLTMTCSVDAALFCLYYIYKTDINVADEFENTTTPSSYSILAKTFNLVETEGWNVARIFWVRAFDILKKDNKQPKSLFGSVDETVFQFLKPRQRHVTKITCSRNDCLKRERTCLSTEIDILCSNEKIEKFETEAVGVCQAMMKRLEEITRAEAIENKYKEGCVYTLNLETNQYEYLRAWLCDSINVQSAANFIYDYPPIIIANVKVLSKRCEEGYEPTAARLRDIKRKIRIRSVEYQLRGVINHKNDHFTTTVISPDGSLYIFDDLKGVRETRTSADPVEIAIYTRIYTF